jgi:hypothetical protein
MIQSKTKQSTFFKKETVAATASTASLHIAPSAAGLVLRKEQRSYTASFIRTSAGKRL